VTVELRRGAVIAVRFDPAEGREIRKTRPAVVVSNNAACRFDAVVQVVPVTALPDRELRPYEALVDSDASGLAKPSRVVANQIRTVSKSRVGRVLGRVTSTEAAELDRALTIQLALDTRD
jgi:mRNA interferase MazF